MTEFVYTIKSHPTSYKGVNFRSRLEATWAAFFDLCGWEWEYEPFDLDGWTPDFIVRDTKDLLVEVKPATFGSIGWREDIALAKGIAGKALNHEVLVLGVGPFRTPVCWSDPKARKETQLGVILDRWPSYVKLHDGPKGIRIVYENKTPYSGEYGKSFEPHLMWSKAKNLTQWKPA